MAIKNILVGWTGLPGAEDALHVAALMARKHDAHLTGLLVHGTSRTAAALAPWISSSAAAPLVEAERERRAAIAAGVPTPALPYESWPTPVPMSTTTGSASTPSWYRRWWPPPRRSSQCTASTPSAT